MFENLVKKAEYALNNLSRDLVFEVYGMAKIARELDVITQHEFMILNHMLIYDGVNNYRNCKLR